MGHRAHDSDPLYNPRTVHNRQEGHTITFSLEESNDERTGAPSVVCVFMCVCGGGGGQLVDEQVYSLRIYPSVLSPRGASLKLCS